LPNENHPFRHQPTYTLFGRHLLPPCTHRSVVLPAFLRCFANLAQVLPSMAKSHFFLLLLPVASLVEAQNTNVCFQSCCQYYNPIFGYSCACATPDMCWNAAGAPVYSCYDRTYGITCVMAVSLAPEKGEPEKAIGDAVAEHKRKSQTKE
jgi:hypothetical protein